jgi:hypothetical protein
VFFAALYQHLRPCLQAESLDKSFEKPLRQHLDTYKTIVNVRRLVWPSDGLINFPQERSASYEKALREKSEIIRQTETGNMNRKQRSMFSSVARELC